MHILSIRFATFVMSVLDTVYHHASGQDATSSFLQQLFVSQYQPVATWLNPQTCIYQCLVLIACHLGRLCSNWRLLVSLD